MNKDFLPGLLLLILVPLVALPAVNPVFGVHNDHFNLVDAAETYLTNRGWDFPAAQLQADADLRRCCEYFIETRWLHSIGRSLNAWLVNLFFLPYARIADFSAGRLVDALLMGLTAGLFFHQLRRRLLVERLRALALAAGLFLLPPVLLYVFWISNMVPGILPVCLGVAAYPLLDDIRRVDWRSRNRRLLWLLPTALLCYLLLCIVYPPNALLLAFYPLIRVLNCQRTGWTAERFAVWRDLLFGFGTASLYFGLTKYVIVPLHGYLDPLVHLWRSLSADRTYQMELSFDPLVILAKVGGALAFTANLWFAPGLGLAGLVAGLAGLAGLHWLLRAAPRPLGQWRGPLLAGLAALALGLAPVIAGKHAFVVGYRNSFVIAGMVMILLVHGLFHLLDRGSGSTPGRLRLAGAAAVVLAAGLNGFLHLRDAGDFYRLEYLFLQQTLPSRGAGIQTLLLERPEPPVRGREDQRLCYPWQGDVRCLLPQEFSAFSSLINHDLHLAMTIKILLRERDYAAPLRLEFTTPSPASVPPGVQRLPLPRPVPHGDDLLLDLEGKL
ncbi:MAG: hypothetical protein HQL82_00525 [Magnetococcales bacterium]|nr:hypothetical protein [Magnetococcales bacterium]